jgi:hypothetical protein
MSRGNLPLIAANLIFRNKFCFSGGYVEAKVVLPGANNVYGLWPAIWSMGNLGRAGYGATLEGNVSCLFPSLLSPPNSPFSSASKVAL